METAQRNGWIWASGVIFALYGTIELFDIYSSSMRIITGTSTYPQFPFEPARQLFHNESLLTRVLALCYVSMFSLWHLSAGIGILALKKWAVYGAILVSIFTMIQTVAFLPLSVIDMIFTMFGCFCLLIGFYGGKLSSD